MTSSCSRESCFSSMSSSFSMAIDASAKSRVCPVAFRAEKDCLKLTKLNSSLQTIALKKAKEGCQKQDG